MMLPDMTPGAWRAVQAAQAWAAAQGLERVEPAHALLGLLAEEEGRPVQLLREQNVDPAALLAELQVQSAAIPIAEEFPAQVDALLQRLLYQARLLALEFSSSKTVTTDLLLLALLEDDAILRDKLQKLGYDAARLRAEFAQQLGPEIRLEEPLQLLDAPEKASLARIVDANANRAREALRILEEAARFHWEDRFLSRLAKEMRHELTGLPLRHFPQSEMLAARDTSGDVGTAIGTPSENVRSSLQAVVQANAQRLQEALRCLEEYGKVHSPAFGQAIESLRYRSYTLQRAMQRREPGPSRLQKARLYVLISKGTCAASLEWTIREAAAGGAGIFQLREKNRSDRTLLAIAREVRQVTREIGAMFILNDRPDLARLAHADGVHLGQEDMGVQEARMILGPEGLIGVSTHSGQQLERAILDGADYVGVGPVFPSQTKSFDELPGLSLVREAAQMTSLPMFAIGGISAENAGQVVAAGLGRVAVGQAICQADDPRQAAAGLLAALPE
jgi:thiamine-phosphate pyrophosphorylase